MITLTTAQLAQILNAELIGADDVACTAISTDTRKPCPNALFFALKGENFDAHNYLNIAAEQGASALVVQTPDRTLRLPQLVVSDTRLALGQLGKWLKTKLAPKTVAMTGSSGKTTVKEMTAAILSHKGKVLFTQGNFNNDIGVPLTLLNLTEEHEFAVIELGANHKGEIAYTTALVQPDVALVNNVAPAHLEGFGSLEGVAQAKGEIYRGLPAQGVAIINADCHYKDSFWRADIGARKCLSFGFATGADFTARNVQLHANGADFELVTPQGNITVQSPYLGQHNVSNALAASALAMQAGASLAQVKAGIEQRNSVKGRLFPVPLNDHVLVIDDSYNANVDSLKAAIAVLEVTQGKRILVVGDMAELGENTQACHRSVAEAAHAAKLDGVYTFGQESAVISALCHGRHFHDKTALCQALLEDIQRCGTAKEKMVILVKGSRSQRMEEVIAQLKDKVC
ncbi:UDP-N-acetylmuramoyl-tripeptide--D-alanyl-D-alanine ligase [Pasteurellaceae bacterium HPA106]|uniref:UDP-N-acetylmuramoyl-tripeptide--D-alanyl-D- alanine ligase n=1 Tax=Spirabiliibacterium pneumoniae TaxID=221400 RepID=UPI001AAE13AD|nr:UDP-N-acetylmuramoyl-tripeptide--D-alanyl-D-alanine ligase [Spirabiliibacterium pneumoniae]MBE2896702.1 UDP-N-acetylmuramoyl-tripeptide--D-alanyl-D-alanine ligase [Spirabiliibacterium pneumoniae]